MIDPHPIHVALHDVTKTFHSKLGPIDAVGPIDLELRQGEFFAVVGPSGCGKSTLLDIMAALSLPEHGGGDSGDLRSHLAPHPERCFDCVPGTHGAEVMGIT